MLHKFEVIITLFFSVFCFQEFVPAFNGLKSLIVERHISFRLGKLKVLRMQIANKNFVFLFVIYFIVI